MIHVILLSNGIYDVICSMCILWRNQTHSIISTLHTGMFRDECNEKTERILAYWVFTYGMVRIIAGIQPSRTAYIMAATTYFSEAVCLEYESYIGEMHKGKVRFVSVVSMGLGLFLLNASCKICFSDE